MEVKREPKEVDCLRIHLKHRAELITFHKSNPDSEQYSKK